jgi:hypothetical protein
MSLPYNSPSPYQIRKHFDEDKLKELAARRNEKSLSQRRKDAKVIRLDFG